MEWQHGEISSEQNEPGGLEAILEWEGFLIFEPEPVINPFPDVPMDDYLEKEPERQEAEKLAKMVEDRIP